MTTSWVRIYPDRDKLGSVAARDIADELRTLLASQEHVRMLFAAAPSQTETLAALAAQPDIDWSRVIAFNMDEYIGLPPAHPQSFGAWLHGAFFDRVPIGRTEVMQGTADPDVLAAYVDRLNATAIDIGCLGIGINGHIAFNDPAVADFSDPHAIKTVDLDETSRRQQVIDECFSRLEDVPQTAVTLTIPTLLSARRIFCMVPGAAKTDAARATILSELSTEWPSTILRTHPRCTLYLDNESAGALRKELAA